MNRKCLPHIPGFLALILGIFPATLVVGETSPLSLTPSWTGRVDTAIRFGDSVASAGDVNGDGYSDIIVGDPDYENGFTGEGGVFVYYGTPSGLPSAASWTGEINEIYAYFGSSVSSAGDVNGDGYSDVIIGAVGNYGGGRAFLYLGSSNGLQHGASWTGTANQGNANYGRAVSSAGDVNNDGYSDVIIGASSYDDGQNNEGAAFLYMGSSSGLLHIASWTGQINQAGSQFGWSVSSAGDVNGDGYSDVIVGAQEYTNGHFGEGGAFLYMGSTSGLSPTPSWTGEIDQAEAFFGWSVAGVGDVNRDGYSDVAVGALIYSNGQDQEGAAFLYLGSTSGLSARASWTTEVNQLDAAFGSAIGGGDINGDGFSDVFVGAYRYESNEVNEGAAFLYLGSPSGLRTTASWTGQANKVSAFFGWSLAAAGDVNGDGYGDLAVGAYNFSDGQPGVGAVMLYNGALTAVPQPTNTWKLTNSSFFTELGACVAAAGDVNGDGYSDIVIGAPGYDNGQTDEGILLLYEGPFNGLQPAAAWTGEINQSSARFGCSASAGDVNGDGYSDLLVGARGYSGDQLFEGAAFLYLGSFTGMETAVSWTAEGNQSQAGLGTVVAVGDVNGDGFADGLVSAPFYDAGRAEEGVVFLYPGSASGFPSSAVWTGRAGQASARIGKALAVGDVNGDGFDDLLVGAPEFDAGEEDEGVAFLYFGSVDGLSSSAAWTGQMNQADALFGDALALGDVNGDGFADALIGALGWDGYKGATFFYPGSASGLSLLPSWTGRVNQVSPQFGSATSVGDVNGDGYGDVIVGAPYFDHDLYDEGAIFVYLGSPAGPSLTASWTGRETVASTYLGETLCVAGDVNGDGLVDILAGAPNSMNGGFFPSGGAAYFFSVIPPAPFAAALKQFDPRSLARIDGMGFSSDLFGQFGIQATNAAAGPFGRDRGRLRWQAAPMGVPFGQDGTQSGVSGWEPLPATSAMTALTVPIPGAGVYRWRARIEYAWGGIPGLMFSRWFWLPHNGASEGDIRLANVPSVLAYYRQGMEDRTSGDPEAWSHSGAITDYQTFIPPSLGPLFPPVDNQGLQVYFGALMDRVFDPATGLTSEEKGLTWLEYLRAQMLVAGEYLVQTERSTFDVDANEPIFADVQDEALVLCSNAAVALRAALKFAPHVDTLRAYDQANGLSGEGSAIREYFRAQEMLIAAGERYAEILGNRALAEGGTDSPSFDMAQTAVRTLQHEINMGSIFPQRVYNRETLLLAGFDNVAVRSQGLVTRFVRLLELIPQLEGEIVLADYSIPNPSVAVPVSAAQQAVDLAKLAWQQAQSSSRDYDQQQTAMRTELERLRAQYLNRLYELTGEDPYVAEYNGGGIPLGTEEKRIAYRDRVLNSSWAKGEIGKARLGQQAKALSIQAAQKTVDGFSKRIAFEEQRNRQSAKLVRQNLGRLTAIDRARGTANAYSYTEERDCFTAPWEDPEPCKYVIDPDRRTYNPGAVAGGFLSAQERAITTAQQLAIEGINSRASVENLRLDQSQASAHLGVVRAEARVDRLNVAQIEQSILTLLNDYASAQDTFADSYFNNPAYRIIRDEDETLAKRRLRLAQSLAFKLAKRMEYEWAERWPRGIDRFAYTWDPEWNVFLDDLSTVFQTVTPYQIEDFLLALREWDSQLRENRANTLTFAPNYGEALSLRRHILGFNDYDDFGNPLPAADAAQNLRLFREFITEHTLTNSVPGFALLDSRKDALLFTFPLNLLARGTPVANYFSAADSWNHKLLEFDFNLVGSLRGFRNGIGPTAQIVMMQRGTSILKLYQSDYDVVIMDPDPFVRTNPNLIWGQPNYAVYKHATINSAGRTANYKGAQFGSDQLFNRPVSATEWTMFIDNGRQVDLYLDWDLLEDIQILVSFQANAPPDIW